MEEPVGFADRLVGGLIVGLLAFGYLWLDNELEFLVFQFWSIYEWTLTPWLRLILSGLTAAIFMVFGAHVTGWVTHHFW
jgi:uncharacterized membrane protein